MFLTILLVAMFIAFVAGLYSVLRDHTVPLMDLHTGSVFRLVDDPTTSWVLRSKKIHGTMTRYAGPFGNTNDRFEYSIIKPGQDLSEVRVLVSYRAKEGDFR